MDFKWYELRRRELEAEGGLAWSPPDLAAMVEGFLAIEDQDPEYFHRGAILMGDGGVRQGKDELPELLADGEELPAGFEVFRPFFFKAGEVLLGPGVAADAENYIRSRNEGEYRVRKLPGGAAVVKVTPGQEEEMAAAIDAEVRRMRREPDPYAASAAITADADADAGDQSAPQLLADVNRLFFAAPIDSTGPAGDPEFPGLEVPYVGVPGAGAGVVVAVVDTGMLPDYATHPTLSYDVLLDPTHDYDNGYRGGYIRFPGGHGTFVAGIVRRVAPAAIIRAVGVLNDKGLVAESDLAVGLNRALDHHPHIVNMSIDCPRPGATLYPVALGPVLARARKDHVLIVAAAGNAGRPEPTWPGALPEVVGVGAVQANGDRAREYSNYGTWVDVFARGDRVVNAFGTGPYRPTRPLPTVNFTGLARWSGTSFAAPIITGLIAAQMSSDHSTAQAARDVVLRECVRVPNLGTAPDGRPARLATLDTSFAPARKVPSP